MVKTRKFHVSLECWWDFPLATPGDFLPAPPHQREERQEQAPSLLPWLTDSPDSDSSLTARGPEVASHSMARRGIPEGSTLRLVLSQVSTWQEHRELVLADHPWLAEDRST